MVPTSGKEAWNDVPMQFEGGSDLDRMAQREQSLFKFKKFYHRMDFSP